MTFICIELFLLGIVGTASMVTDIYIAMALGHLSNKHRVAMSFVWFIVIQTALSFLTGLLGIVLGNIPAFSLFIGNFFLISPIVGTHRVLWFSILVGLVETLIFYFGTTWVLKNKLNLE